MRRRWTCTLVLCGVAALAGASPVSARGQDAAPATEKRVVRGMHDQILFQKDVARIAVGDDAVLKADVLNSRSILLLGRATGRTSLLVWYKDDTLQSFVIAVSPDLDMLQRALREIHPNISVEIAPDREAVVLRGTVPDVTFSRAAEAAASTYLQSGVGGESAPLVTAPGSGGADASNPTIRPTERKSRESSVINLIRVDKLPQTVEQRLQQSLEDIGTNDVRVRRLVRGDFPNDAVDVLLLRGKVKNQVELTRVLHLAATMLLGGSEGTMAIKVLGDEGGGVATTGGGGRASQSNRSSSGVSTTSGFSGTAPETDLDLNPGRAKAVSVGNGRILSFIEVSDLPQVRVDVRLYEINRTKLLTYAPEFTFIWSDFDQGKLLPSSQAVGIQGTNAARVGGAGKSEVQGVLGFLSDGYSQQIQVSGDNAAISATLQLLEERGIARALSNPSLTVLSGESASFQVGGQVPVPQAFSPALGTTTGTNTATAGVFNSVEFRSFGVNLAMRPMVGDDDKVTISLSSVVDQPDETLTTTIRDSTGTDQTTTAFSSRSIQTTTRLGDGQALMIGGLIGRNSTDGASYTPGLERIPLIGWMFKRYSVKDEDRELIVVVTPTVVRDRLVDMGGWDFPNLSASARKWVDDTLKWSRDEWPVETGKHKPVNKVSGQ